MIPGRQLTFASMLQALRRRRWLLTVPLFLGVLGGLLVSRFTPSRYRSDAVVEVVPQRIPESYVQSTVTARVEDRLTSIAQQVLSRTQMEAVINEFNLYPSERRRKPMEDVFELMTSRVSVAPVEAAGGNRSSRGGQVDAFRISFEYDDPKIARDVVARLAGFFIDRNATERGSQADQTSAFLAAQLADARARLEAQERKLKTFRERNSGRLPTQMQTNLQAIQSMQLSLQAMSESLARDRDRRLLLERLYSDAAADEPVTPPVAASTDAASKVPPLATPQQRLEAQKALLTQLQGRLSEKHPDIIRTKRQIADLEALVAAEALERPLSPEAAGARVVTPEEVRRRDKLREMRAEIESLDRQVAFKEGEEKRLRGEIAAYQAKLEAVPGIESEWVALTRDYDTLQASYRELLAKNENSKMAASLEQRQIGERFTILDPPRIPLKATSPNRLKINALASLLGLCVGFLLVGLTELRDTTMRSEADLMGALDFPVLALLPLVATAADKRRDERSRRLVAVAVAMVLVCTAAVGWYLRLWKYVA